ncbi:ParM/StbA family protein [Pseudanabaena sp. FACHB-2040]|uniref:ParM/StbA family protein n=1 Tax=Pseudanabaena sp. FACHB-2040 TaxID=2692859 RepID=UPI0018F020DE|nr:ParM/StbA family protein [Pseudanabaena sp. FACHB-2040]
MNQTSLVKTSSDAEVPKENGGLPKSILSVDLGRTSTKTSISRDPNSVVFIPANVKHLAMEQVQGGAFEARATEPLSDIWLVYQGSGYAVGQLAEDFGANLGVGQSKVNDALVKVLACIGYFQLRDEISVVLGLPYHSQDQFEREKEQLISLLMGPHVMSYRGEPITITINKVWVMPEGYGSILWSEVQEKKDASLDFTKLPVAIVDIGHQTTDCLMVDNFRFARGVSRSEAFAMSQFYEQVASQIEGADSQSLALIAAVNRPKGERFYRPRGANKPTNLDDILPNLKESFSREMCNRLLAWLPERVTDVILTGGGGEFFWEDIQRLLKEAKINAHLATPCRQANALGQYIYGEAQVAAARSARSVA